jgi:hypothetical protein
MFTVLTDIHKPPVEGNFCNSLGKAEEPAIVMDYLGTCAMSTKGTELLIAIWLVRERDSGRKDYFSTSWT